MEAIPCGSSTATTVGPRPSVSIDAELQGQATANSAARAFVKTLRATVDTSGVLPPSFTWVHWKVLDLAFDETPLPDLVEAHRYVGEGEERTVPASSRAETLQAVQDLLGMGAINVVWDSVLTAPEVAAVLENPASWRRDSIHVVPYAIVDAPGAMDLLRSRSSNG